MLTTIKSGIDFSITSSNEGVLDFKTCIFPNHFLMAICASPGYGKTTLIKFLLSSNDFFYKKYDFVLLVSPSLIEYNDLFIPKENTSNKLETCWINEKFSLINEEYKKTYTNVLLILDDVVSSVNKEKNSEELMAIIFNRRHVLVNGMVSIIITTQKFNIIPTIMRTTLNVLILFDVIKKEIETIKDNIIKSDIDFTSILSLCFKNPGDFLIYNVKTNKFYLKFDEIV